MKKTLLVSVLLTCFFLADAKHITGGEMMYTYIGPGSSPNSAQYRITLMLFRDESCLDCAGMPTDVTIGIFNNDNNTLYAAFSGIPINNTTGVSTNSLPPCITNPPTLTYTVGYYSFNVELPANSFGYTAAYQTCCRIDGIQNVPNSVGATYTCKMPGTRSFPA